ncbi:MAG: ABC transporter substrate-binding protein [Spirochaetaceae bacterium]|jgi:polar amino acid transport system substrate-binding protein|nr:ABC transporter substrate-binding protein [Spirochaetaceae bacterium]
MKPICKTLIIFFSSAALLAALYTGCKRQTEQQSRLTIKEGLLKVGVEIGYPPMEYYDTDGKTPIGFDIDLTRALADKLGLKVEYIDIDWEGILAGLDTNRYDIAVNITILPERQNKYNFTKPYIYSFITIAGLKDSNFKIEKPEDIAGRSVCYQASTSAQYFTERLNARGVNFTSYSYDKILNCFNDLELGRVDLLVSDNIAAMDYTEKEDSPFEIVWRDTAGESIGICLKKGNDALANALNKALDELFESGDTPRIYQKYSIVN